MLPLIKPELSNQLYGAHISGALSRRATFLSQPFTPGCHALDTLNYITECSVGYNASIETFEGHALDTVAAKWFFSIRGEKTFLTVFTAAMNRGVSILELALPCLWPAI